MSNHDSNEIPLAIFHPFTGPCAGKTTSQARLSTFFENLGWKVRDKHCIYIFIMSTLFLSTQTSGKELSIISLLWIFSIGTNAKSSQTTVAQNFQQLNLKSL